MCEEKLDAVQRCVDCEQNFCKICSKAHFRLNIAKNHTLVNIDSVEGKRYLISTAFCEKHKNEEMTFYCRTCLVPVCMRCRLTVHEDHTTEDMVDFASKARKELRISLDENKGYRFSMLNEIEGLRCYKEKMEDRVKAVKKSIQARRQQFHNAVDRICNQMEAHLDKEVTFETKRVEEDKDQMEQDMLKLSNKIAMANQMVDFGSDMEIAKNRQNILESLAYSRKEVPLSLIAVKMNVDFSFQKQAENSLKYLIGRLSTDIIPPTYVKVVEMSTFRVENTSDVINAICPSPDGKCWIACGWKSDIMLYDRYGEMHRVKTVGRDVDFLTIDSDGNSYVSCRDEHAVKRFDRNFRRRMATLNIEYPRGIATTNDNKLIICVNKTTTYFEYEEGHENKVLKLGPDGDESKELKNPKLSFKYPIRVAVNYDDELCVSDNLKNAVLFLRPSGELKSVYTGERPTNDIALVRVCTVKTGYTSTPRPGAVSLKLPESRKEQDGPISAQHNSVLDKTNTPPNSPKTKETNGKELAPLNMSYEDTFVSSVTLDTERKQTQTFSHSDKVLLRAKALSGMTGAGDVASVTTVSSENDFEHQMPPFDPRGITCDRYGHVIVADYSSNMIHLLDKHGRFLMYLLTEADGIFGPTSVAVDKYGLLWVGGGDATIKVYKYINTETELDI